jgi:hypothetical protein
MLPADVACHDGVIFGIPRFGKRRIMDSRSVKCGETKLTVEATVTVGTGEKRLFGFLIVGPPTSTSESSNSSSTFLVLFPSPKLSEGGKV